jgi:Fic family protein
MTGRLTARTVRDVAIRAEVHAGPQTGLQQALEAAVLALGRLDGVSTLLPDTSLSLHSYVRTEAVLSAQIEGTQSSLSLSS